jgi:hypothetical protein
MSANLDKSLDDLVGSRRQSARRRGGLRRSTSKKPAVGGVKKSTKAAPKPAHPAPVAHTASSKILVSGLVCLKSMLLIFHICSYANFFSLPMLLRAISRYVDKKALTSAFIAFSFVESLAAQTISTHLRTFLYLSHIDG